MAGIEIDVRVHDTCRKKRKTKKDQSINQIKLLKPAHVTPSPENPSLHAQENPTPKSVQ